MFTKVVKHNIKDKKQLQFDLRFARYMVGTNLSMAHAGNIETLEFFEEFLPIYHIKNPSTFTRYYSGLFALLRIQHNITAHICIIAITTSNFCNSRISLQVLQLLQLPVPVRKDLPKMMPRLLKDLPKLPESVLGEVCSPRLSSTTSRTRNSSSLT